MIPEYIYHRSEPKAIPKILLGTLSENKINPSDIVLCIPGDKDKTGQSCDSYMLCDGKWLYVISGIVNSVIKKHKINERHFVQTGIEKFDVTAFTSFEVEESVSSLALTANGKDGGRYIIAMSSLTKRNELDSAKYYLSEICVGKTPKPLPESEEDLLFCPKCGARYTDPANKICAECMSRSRILARTWEFMKKYKGKILAVIGMLLLTGAIGIITPYFSSKFFYDNVLGDDKTNPFYGAVLLVVGIVVGTRVLSAVLSALQSIVTSIIAARLSYDLKKTIFSSIQRLTVGFFTSRKTGGLMTQVSGDAGTIYWFFCDGVPYFLVNIVQIIAVTIIIFIMNPLLAALSLIMFPIAFLAVRSLYGSMRKYHMRRFSKHRSMNSHLSDVLSGIRVVKAFAKEDDETKRFGRQSESAANADKDTSDYAATRMPAVNFLLNISSMIVWGVGGYMVIKGYSGMTYGILAAFISYMNMVYSPMFSLVGMVNQTTDSFNAMGRLVEIMDAVPDVVEKENPVVIKDFKGSVEFRNVSFAYDPAKEILKDVSFKVEPGHSLGIVGHTGAGKSTLVNLLIRLYDTTSGDVFIDGVNIKDISLKQLHEKTAIVSQETYLFIGTVYENIAYACPDATPENVIYAAKIAGAHEFISRMTEGYDTMIGMGYAGLSGGERQRISIARAILRNPKILIMDEATAAMDTETERNIQTALERLSEGRTTITIAHRLSTLRDVDSLIVIEDGKIAERGTHNELIRQKGIYNTLYTLQLDAMKNLNTEA